MNRIKLNDISYIITKGTTPTTVGGQFIKKGVNFVKSESICNSKFLDSSVFEHISLDIDEKIKRSRLKSGDLLFSIAGAYLGKVAIVRDCDLPANTNQAVGIVRINHDLVDVNYLYYYFSQSYINNYIKRLSAQSSQPNLNLEILGELLFDNKPLNEQKAISNLLSNIDNKIEINNNINSELELLAKTIYDYWFLQFEFPNEEGKPYKSSGGKMVYNEELKREIPDGWEVKKIGDILIESNKSSVQVNEALEQGTYPFFTSGADIFRYNDYFVDGFNIFLNTGGNPDIKGYKGKCAYSTDTWCISAEKYSYILYYYLLKMILQFEQLFFAGSGLKHLQKDAFKSKLIILPNEEILKQFNCKMDSMWTQQYNGFIEIQQLTSLRDWLLPMLMNGQVTFKENK